MALNAMHANLVARLVIVDIAPVAYAHTQLPLTHAMRVVDLDSC